VPDGIIDVTEANEALSGFAAFGSRPRAGRALYLGFDRALDAADAALSLYVWTTGWRRDGATRAVLLAEQTGIAARLPKNCPVPDWRLHYRVATAWEFYAGANMWQQLRNAVDETRALTLSGFVRFTAPVDHQPGGVAGLSGAQFFIRCRILRGRFECPPELA